jgi:plastocyanin
MRCIPKPAHLALLMVVLVVFITVSGCTGNSPSSITPAATPTQVPGTMTVNIQNFAFVPANITVPKGTTVTWVNLDTSTHQIRNDIHGSIAQGALFSSDSLLKDARYSFKFDTPGTYPYYCSIHPSMKGTVIVT